MMVEINIKEKTYLFLRDLMIDISKQDNRATSTPYYYIIVRHGGLKAFGHPIFLTQKTADKYCEDPPGFTHYIEAGFKNPQLMRLHEALEEVTGVKTGR